MKNSEYWKVRFEQIEAAANKSAVETFETVQKQYLAAERETEQQISTWYQRFAKNNNITMAEARKLLTTKELAEFKWDVKEFIKYGEENELNQQWIKELENASARFHVSRLEALKIQTQQTVEKLFGNQTDGIDRLLKKNYLEGYYHTVYEIHKGFNIGWDIAAVDDNTVEKLISKPWATDGKNFSDRIWSNKTNLINEVQTQLTRTFMLGRSPDEAIKAIADKMKTSKNQAGRLVMTESAFFASSSQGDAFKSLDVERYEIVATLDSRTSEICQELDGQIFDMKDFQPGVTAPPFHVWCRTTTVPHFDDNYTERAARGADGKTYYVPGDMKYADWKKTFVDGGSKDGLKPVTESGKIKNQTFTDKIKAVKDRIAGNGGKITEADIHEAGEAFRVEIETGRASSKKAWDDARQAYNESDIKKQIDELEKKKDELYKKYNSAPWGSERNQLYDEWNTAKSEYWKVYSGEEAAAFRTRIRDTQKAYTGTWEANSSELKSKLETFRTCGVGDKDMNSVHYANRGTLRNVVTKAYDCYPSDWVDASVAKNKLSITKVNRGFYDGHTVAISSNSMEKQMETAFHELGHRFEHVVPGIYDAEDVFYKRRTAGEKLEWLGSGYRKNERTRKDKFIHPYMGKEYPDKYYELCSMGFGYAFTNPTELLKDEDFAQLIYGILSLY